MSSVLLVALALAWGVAAIPTALARIVPRDGKLDFRASARLRTTAGFSGNSPIDPPGIPARPARWSRRDFRVARQPLHRRCRRQVGEA